MVKAAYVTDLGDVNDVAAALARTQAAELIAGLSKTKQKVVRSLVARALEHGWSHDTLTKRIQQQVGLDERYSRAVEAYRKGLLDQGQTPYRANLAAERYAKRLRKHRASVIAHHEVQQVLMDAQRSIWTQDQEDGNLSRYAVRKWVTHPDEKRCKVCKPMNGRRASLKRGSLGYNVKGVGRVVGPPIHPNCRCYEVVEDQGVVKTDPELWGDEPLGPLSQLVNESEVMRDEVSNPLAKHLSGEHNQKTHGRRKRIRHLSGESGFRPDIRRMLEWQAGQPGPSGDFAEALLQLSKEFPQVAKNVKGVLISTGSTREAWELNGSKGAVPIAYVEYTSNGAQINFDPDRMLEYAEKTRARHREGNTRPWGIPDAGVEVEPDDFLKDLAEGTAVHEWGHLVHQHYAAATFGEANNILRMDELHARRRQGEGMENLRPISLYAKESKAEAFAEWWTAYWYDMVPTGFVDPDWEKGVLATLTENVYMARGASILNKMFRRDSHEIDIHTDFDGSVVEGIAFGLKKRGRAVVGRTLGPDFRFRDLLGDHHAGT